MIVGGSMNRRFWCATLITFGFAAFSLTASAQRLDGTLRGTVEDPSGAVVHDATVTATNEVTGSTHSTQTTTVGEYVFPNLLPGLYTVQVQVPRFAKYIRQSVRVLPNEVVTADARLTIESVGATIEVAVTGGEIVSRHRRSFLTILIRTPYQIFQIQITQALHSIWPCLLPTRRRRERACWVKVGRSAARVRE